jgi:protein required for attachment to host cells
MKNWLVVGNAARARVLEEADAGRGYLHVADLVHPESRQKGVELAAGRPGHVMGSAHVGGTAYEPRTDVREREHDLFAREVAGLLNDGVAGGRCAGLVLVASNPFLGHLKAHLSGPAQKLVLRTVAADYTALDEADLRRRLGQP